CMGCCQCASDLNSELHGFGNGWRASNQSLCQRLSLYELAGDKNSAIRLPDLVHRNNVRLIQRRGRACFALEPVRSFRIVLELERQQLQCNLPSEFQV